MAPAKKSAAKKPNQFSTGTRKSGNGNTVALRVKSEKGKPRGSYEHLRKYQYKKGECGNPGGVPKSSGTAKISVAYEAALGAKLPADVQELLGLEPNSTWADAIAIQMVRRAVDMDIANPGFQAVTELRETTEGKNADKNELSGPGGVPLAAPAFNVTFTKPQDEWDETPTVET